MSAVTVVCVADVPTAEWPAIILLLSCSLSSTTASSLSLRHASPSVRFLTLAATTTTAETDVIVVGSAWGARGDPGRVRPRDGAGGAPGAGGAAHGFTQRAGVEAHSASTRARPSSPGPEAGGSGGTNPLKDLLDALGEEVPCHVYDISGAPPEGNFTHRPDFKRPRSRRCHAPVQRGGARGEDGALAAAVAAMPAAAPAATPRR